MSVSTPPSPGEETPAFDLNLQHGHKDLVQAVAFNTYGDRCATGSVDGKIRVFNRHKDGTWRLCDTWTAHGGEILEVTQPLWKIVPCLQIFFVLCCILSHMHADLLLP
jgi:nucleoporin SEH1